MCFYEISYEWWMKNLFSLRNLRVFIVSFVKYVPNIYYDAMIYCNKQYVTEFNVMLPFTYLQDDSRHMMTLLPGGMLMYTFFFTNYAIC